MIKISAIHKSIVKRIKQEYPNISFNSQKDITEGFDRPSFFVDFSNIGSVDFMRTAKDLDISVDITFFPTTIDNNKLEIYETIDNLEKLFLENNLVTIDKYMKFEVDDLTFDVIDKVLHCYFDIKISEDYNRISYKENMEELDLGFETN